MRFAGARVLLCAFSFTILCSGSSRSAAQPNANVDLFEFHSGFWNNLHHFLCRQAQLAEPQKRPGDLFLAKADSDELQQLSADERDTWNEAISYYSNFIVKRDLLFDDELIQTKDQIENAEASSDLEGVKIPAELKAVLIRAAPVYRRHWWPRHNMENQQWITHLEPLIKRYGATLSTQVMRIYDEPWPQYPVRVDAVAYANWAGAYTTIEPTRPTISTTDPANQGVAALEVLFHETTHGMMDKVMEAMHSAETNLNAHGSGSAFYSGSIWHALLFYTTGELVAGQISSYTPYADKNGLWVRAWPSRDRSLIEQDWKPHMDGSITLQQALTKLVRDLASTAQ
jgi:hypothetical protein